MEGTLMQPIIPPRRGVSVDRIELRTGRRQDLFQSTFVTSLAREVCPGVKVVEGRAEPDELPEGFLPHHALAVNVGGPTTCEMWWPGQGWKAAVAPPLGVHLFPALRPYAARWSQPVESLVVDIAPAFVAAAAGPEVAPHWLDLDPTAAVNDPVVAHTALAIAEEARAGAPGGRLCAESLATALVAHLLRCPTEALPRAPRRAALSKPKLDRVLEYVTEHLARNISLRDLAALVNMDVFGFVRAFKQSTGLPPHQYVLRARVERAKALLRDGQLSVSDVALATGFATPSHFATTFRRLTRATPRAYRDSSLP
jgi:AraC family transcriptional regulator